MSELLTCQGLSKRYGAVNALDSVDLSLPKGKIIGLLGPNGSGKTTFLKIAAGLLTPTSGKILINGLEPGSESKKAISFLPERTYLNDWMNVETMIDFFQSFYKDFEPKRAYDMLQRLGITPDMPLKTMSKGTREKVQLILVMSRTAQLFLLDEPIGGVDPAARDYILRTIIGNYREDATVVISTHLIADVEQVLDHVIFLSKGQVALDASVDDIRERDGKSVDTLFREVFKC